MGWEMKHENLVSDELIRANIHFASPVCNFRVRVVFGLSFRLGLGLLFMSLQGL